MILKIKSLRNTQVFKTLKIQSQTTYSPPPLPQQRLGPLTSFGPSQCWIAPPRKKSWLRAAQVEFNLYLKTIF